MFAYTIKDAIPALQRDAQTHHASPRANRGRGTSWEGCPRSPWVSSGSRRHGVLSALAHRLRLVPVDVASLGTLNRMRTQHRWALRQAPGPSGEKPPRESHPESAGLQGTSRPITSAWQLDARAQAGSGCLGMDDVDWHWSPDSRERVWEKNGGMPARGRQDSINLLHGPAGASAHARHRATRRRGARVGPAPPRQAGRRRQPGSVARRLRRTHASLPLARSTHSSSP